MARIRRHLRPGAKPQPDGDKLASLTPREQEVLDLLACGLDQSEIAKTLVITSKTVSTHIQHILEKLGVHSRAQAVAVAHRNGLSKAF